MKKHNSDKSFVHKIQRNSYHDAIRDYFDYKTEKTINETMKYFCSTGYFYIDGVELVLTDKIKNEFWELV